MNTGQMRNYIFLSLIGLLGISLSSCHDEPKAASAETARRTVLVYQVANNNLGDSRYDQMDIEEMLNGAKSGSLYGDCRLLVYNARSEQSTYLLDITPTGIDTLKSYDSEVLSVDSRRMLEVFKDMETFAPAKDYGLVLWSHGSGWLQDGIADDNDGDMRPKSFGSEGANKTMNITTLANTLAQGPALSFIYFDCCYMASIETLYELRHAAPYIVASATELIVYGMPYDKNIGCFFAQGEADLITAANNTFELYDSQTGSNRTCSMSVTDTRHLVELAAATKAIYTAAEPKLPESYRPQRFMSNHITPCYYYDFGNYIKALCLTEAGEERFEEAASLYTTYAAALEKSVIYANATPYLWNSVPLTYHCGLSTHIVQAEKDTMLKNYSTLSWYSDVTKALFK